MNDIKIVNIQQAKDFHHYKNKRSYIKVLPPFNLTICRTIHLTPDYVNVKVNGTSHQFFKTLDAANIFRLK